MLLRNQIAINGNVNYNGNIVNGGYDSVYGYGNANVNVGNINNKAQLSPNQRPKPRKCKIEVFSRSLSRSQSK